MIIEYEFGEEYEFEVDYDELRKVLTKMLCDDVKQKQGKLYNEDGAYQMAMYVLYDLDLVDEVAECYEDELREYFEDKARAEYRETVEDGKEKDDWYGTKNDVRGI